MFITKVLLALCIILTCSACQSVNMSERAAPIGQNKTVVDRRVITDMALENSASIVGVSEGRTSDGLLRVQVELLNRTWQAADISYTFEWLDTEGMIVNPAVPSYFPLRILSGESQLVTGIAPQANVVDFRFKIKSK